MKKGRRTRERYKMLGWQGMLLFVAILFMTIAYAQISGQQMTVEADATAEAQTGVFIADVVSQDTTNGKINYYQGTLLSSKVTLPSSSSTVTYEVTLYNNSNENYVYIGELIDENAYKGENGEKNESIGYTINGLTKGVTTIAPKASLPFTITFAFKDGADTSNNVLESIINFRFKELPIIDLSNENVTYTLENVYPGFETAEYEFIVQNYTETDTNHVPMKYHFETTIDSPIQAKIYDENGTEVTGEINLKADGQAEEHTYTLKIIWDANDTEFDIENAICNVKLIAKPTDERYENYDEKYEDYEIVKEFNINPITIKKAARVQAGEKATETSTYTDGTNTAVIPAGFTVSGLPYEKIIEDGLVIYLIDDKTEEEIKAIDWYDGTIKQKYDQFVWIPMPQGNINDMYMCQSENGTKSCNIKVQEINGKETAYCTTHSSTLMAGRLYDDGVDENYNAGKTNQTYSRGNGFREPDTVPSCDDNTRYLSQLNGILGTSYASSSDLMTDLQKEYNEIVKSVYQNEGFYIGRYETSGMQNSDTNATIKVVAGSDNSTNSNISGVTWYRMYAQQKKYAENIGLTSSIGSTMIQGAAYDQVMKFVDGSKGGRWTFDVTSRIEARHTGELGATGDNSYDIVKNIRDLESNLDARTTEAFASTARVERGGYYANYMASAASYRTVASPSVGGSITGTICQLYIKCVHEYVEGVCTKCGEECEHKYSNGVCTICGEEQPPIPISTVEQLLKIGSNEKITIDGETHTFSSDAKYELQNNITFAVADYIGQYPNAFGEGTIKIENQVTPFETANTTSSPYSTYPAPATGTYKLEVWGAQGGTYNSTYATGGKGGYSVGTITLNEGDNLYVYVGRVGSYGGLTSYTSTGGAGYNGGGAAAYRGGAGGGATDIRFTAGNWNDSSSLLSRVIVAGGGGGAFAYSSTYKAAGGNGGGTSGGDGSNYNSSYSGFRGRGATQTSGGTAGTGSSTNYNGKAGTFGTGGNTGYKYNSTGYYSNGAGRRRLVWWRSSRKLQ